MTSDPSWLRVAWHQRRSYWELPEAERMMLEVSEANTAATALYLGHGFAVIDRRRRYYPDGTDALIMERPLRA